MNSMTVKAIGSLLAVLILAAAAAPACVGSAECSMPCCRHEAGHGSPPGEAPASAPCCPPAAEPADGGASGCRFVANHLALPTAADPGPASTAAAGEAVGIQPLPPPDRLHTARRTGPPPPETPLFLRLQTLLI
jgi:hypothetical protein